MKLIFHSTNGKERIIGEPTSLKEAGKIINDFLDDHNFKSYYTRLWFEEDRLKYDVGSHTEFFFLEDITDEIMEELRQKGLYK